MKKQKTTFQEQGIREQILDLLPGHVIFSCRKDLKTEEEKALYDIYEVLEKNRV